MSELNETYSTDNQRILSNALTRAGVEFLQKQCIHGYYLDFTFPGHKLLVEVDSNTYSNKSQNKTKQKDYEEKRDAHLSQLGYQIVRYSSQAVKNCSKGVVLGIQRHLLAK